MTERYSSFAEIDERLKILRLQREIYKESLKLDMNRAKTRLNLVQLIGNVALGWKPLVMNLAINKGLQGLQKLRRKNPAR